MAATTLKKEFETGMFTNVKQQKFSKHLGRDQLGEERCPIHV